MKTQIRTLFLSAALACFFTLTFAAFAQEKPAPQPAEKSTPPAAPAEAAEPASDDKAAAQPAEPEETEEKAAPALRRLDEPQTAVSEGKTGDDDKVSASDSDSDTEQAKPVAPKKKTKKSHPGRVTHDNGNDKVGIFHNAHLRKGEKAGSVVSVLGSSTSEGEVTDAVVSILGHNRVTGPVGDTVVSVLGNTYVNSKVGGQVVTILGNLELGPEADVNDIVIVGGHITRDPQAVVHGHIDGSEMDGDFGELDWLHAWIERCVFLGRPLAFGPHLGWAWMIALGFLAFYVFLALLFGKGIERCAQTLETRPGYSILATVLTVLLTPLVGILLIVLLAITGVGLVLIPFLLAALFFATLFGKAVMLAWLGRRITKFFGDGPLGHAAVAVLLGGLIVLVLYTVPVMGLIVYKLFDMLGVGVVIYTLLLNMQREKPKAPAPAPVAVATAAAAATNAAATPAPATPTPMRSAGFVGAAEQAPVPDAAATPVEAEAGAGAVPVPPVAPVPPVMAYTAATLPRAGFWIRFAASFLDWVIIGAACGILHAGSGVSFVFAAYCVVLWATRGTTVGGIVCGLKVVRLDDRPVDWSVALVRALGGFLSLAVAGLGFIWVAFDHDKQSWHDKIAGTTIVRLPKGASII